MLEYKGYTGVVTYDDEARIFHGEVINLKDVVTFQGKHVDELEQAFIDSVDDYLEWCAKLGRAPEKPFSGKFMLRVDPQIHKEAATAAQLCGMSLNTWVTEAIKAAKDKHI